ncbi:hypothetical protein M885DRAFT_539219 [Pelagophyceae sp. CCMP2097]|nr:hypothetical protein M885DRAFT_539219 [Pelagophyceae sp. CCMP2097]
MAALREIELPSAWRGGDQSLPAVAAALGESIVDLEKDLGDIATAYAPALGNGGEALDDVRAALKSVGAAGALKCAPRARRDMSIRPTEAGVALEFSGLARRAFVSDNALVSHRDARCVADEDVCTFSLVRLLCGFAVTPQTPEAEKALKWLRAHADECDEGDDDGVVADDVADGGSRAGAVLCKGEGVDVSFPLRDDVNLALWLESEAEAPGSFVREATLAASGSGPPRKVRCESLDALILEQRDLTFGKRAQHVVIWRVAKAPKRLRRLVELVGIKMLASRQAPWAVKAGAFALLLATLERFAASELHAAKPLAVKPPSQRKAVAFADDADDATVSDEAPRARRGARGKSLGGGVVDAARRRDRRALEDGNTPLPPRSAAKAPRPAGVFSAAAAREMADACVSDAVVDATGAAGLNSAQGRACRALFDSTLATAALLLPLQHLSLRVFADNSSLPPNFAQQWGATLRPLCDLVRLFREACDQVKLLPQADQGDFSLDEAKLYDFHLGSMWHD